MNICSDNHDEIVFEGIVCPFCLMIEEKEDTIKDLEKQVNDLTRQIPE